MIFPPNRLIPMTCALCLSAGVAVAFDAPVVELNTATAAQDACRLTFTVTAPAGLSALETQTVLFDQAGGVRAFTLFDFGTVPEGGLRVRQFDIPQTRCDDVGMILFNSVETCTTFAGNACGGDISFTSRSDTMEVQQ
ncbi:hypothetical protein [Celeribacter baekdonensis]|uniref:hypothetical protein n=1 Tax=Celeribacter baekdonensis TaxID=875171 RepID=UPI0030DA564B|tara:strand:+ start:117381 stop:117794 length:414 start_codon:yes stop_codon:yes gene_type:complete